MKYSVNDSYFENIDSEDKAYFLGFIMADGNLAKGQHTEEYIRVSLHLQVSDIEILEKFKYYVEQNHKIFIGSHFNDCALRFVQRKMVNDLRKYGITERKTGSEHINLEMIPHEMHRHFFRGLIDGDGWICIGDASQSLGLCGSYEMCKSFVEYLNRELQTTLLKVSKVKDKNCYKVSYSSIYDMQNIQKLLYQNATVYLSRKKAIADTLY